MRWLRSIIGSGEILYVWDYKTGRWQEALVIEDAVNTTKCKVRLATATLYTWVDLDEVHVTRTKPEELAFYSCYSWAESKGMGWEQYVSSMASDSHVTNYEWS